MKKISLLLLVFVIGLLADGQDYIITWQNDTIACKMAGDPKKAGIKPAWKYEDGHQRIVTIYDNDSVRIISAGEIKGYIRKEHGKWLLCDGNFETKQIVTENNDKRTFVEEDGPGNKPTWQFLNRIVEGKYANLYIWYQNHGSCIYPTYYLQRHGIEKENTVIRFYNRKKMVALLSDSDIASEMKEVKYRRSNKGYSEIVKEYNRLKEAAAN